MSRLFAAEGLVSFPITDLITFPPTYFTALTIFRLTADKGILRLDILLNISLKVWVIFRGSHQLLAIPGQAPIASISSLNFGPWSTKLGGTVHQKNDPQ